MGLRRGVKRKLTGMAILNSNYSYPKLKYVYIIYYNIKNTTRFQTHISINKPFKMRISRISIILDLLVCKSRKTFIITFFLLL